MNPLWDCAIVGGGPAGLSAALVLGRVNRKVLLLDAGHPRNFVTRETHGYLTRDGIPPYAFRRIAHEELGRYPGVRIVNTTVSGAKRQGRHFELATEDGTVYQARKIILAMGLAEKLPDVPDIHQYYGISLFSCPYCDGWEHRDEPLIVIAENAHAFDLVKSVYPWSRRLALATNGHYVVSRTQRLKLDERQIPVYEQKIAALVGRNGRLEKVVFEDGTEERRTGGFVSPVWSHAGSIHVMLGCRLNGHGGIDVDDFGRTSVRGVFAAGDAANIVPPQLIVAAADGCRAAIGVNSELTEEDF